MHRRRTTKKPVQGTGFLLEVNGFAEFQCMTTGIWASEA